MKSAFFAGTVASLFAAAAVPSATGATYDYTGTAGLWNVAATDISSDKWTSKAAPEAGHDYRINGSSKAYHCGFGSGTFAGNSLRMTGANANLVICGHSSGLTYTFPNDGLFLDGGTLWTYNWHAVQTIAGKVTVGGTVLLQSYNAPYSITFSGPVSGSDKAVMNIREHSDMSAQGEYTVYFSGDMSGYNGKLSVGTSSKKWGRLYIGDTTIPGTIEVNATGTLGPYAKGKEFGAFSVGNLNLAANSTLRLSINTTTCGTIRVTNKLTLPTTGKVKLVMSSYPTDNTSNYSSMKRPLIIAPPNSNINPDAFDVTIVPTRLPFVWFRSTLLVEKTETAETLYWYVRPHDSMKTGDGWNQSALLPAYASHWAGLKDGDSMNPILFYWVNGYDLSTPRVYSGVHTFAGWGLGISNNSKFSIYQSFKCDHLLLYPNAKVNISQTTSPGYLQGKVTVAKSDATSTSPTYIHGNNSTKTFDIQAEIEGDGKLYITTSTTLVGDGSPTVKLSGLNTNYVGRFSVSNAKSGTYTTTVSVSDKRNFGGAMSAFAYDAFTFLGGNRLDVTASVDFNEPTRGFFVNGAGRLRVPNIADEVKIWSQLTMAGKLVKEGAGALALGGACRFTSAQGATPLEGTNVLEVAAGRIKAIAKTGYDGLAIKFAAGTGIELPRETEASEDVKAFGVYDVAWATPFDLSACGGVLNVGFRDWTDLPRGLEMAVCTVSSAAAAGLRGKINFVKEPGHVVNIVERDNGDGTVTFVAQVARAGFIIMVK